MKSIYIRCYFYFSLLLSLNVTAQPGSLDITFGNAGKVITNNGWQSVTGVTCLIQPDEKIVVGGAGYNGTLNYGWTLYRFQSNGISDPSFGLSGFIDESYIGPSWVVDITLQTDQKIVEFGYWGLISVIKRWNTDGTLDISFGTGGEVLCNGMGEFKAMNILPNDKLILAGKSYGSQSYGPAVVCIDLYGNLDQSFGNGGICAIPDTTFDLLFFSALQSENKIIVLGHNYDGNRFIIARINADGIIDSSFGLNGIASFQFWSGYLEIKEVITDLTNNILVTGNISTNNVEDPFLIRITPDGLIDSTFNQIGFVSHSYGSDYFEHWNTIAVQKDKKIIVAGVSGDSLLLCSFFDDGSIDTAFGNYGVVKNHFGGYRTTINDVCIQEDGKILATGGSGFDHMVLRYNTELSIGLNEIEPAIFAFTMYPNPLQNQAVLEYSLKSRTPVSVSLLNTLGQTVAVFIDNSMREAGSHSETLSFHSNYLPGMYFVRIACGGDTKLIKCEIY
jgi:uncharacterized delta-60 repeat protein